ncbi:MAG: hypothetical protein Q9207_002732 [Kuettlingeria erythrocarpa]
MTHFLSHRTPITGGGWSGPGARSSAMNDDENKIYAAIKAQVKLGEARRREEQGLPPRKSMNHEGEMELVGRDRTSADGGGGTVKEKRPSMASRAFKGFKKML